MKLHLPKRISPSYFDTRLGVPVISGKLAANGFFRVTPLSMFKSLFNKAFILLILCQLFGAFRALGQSQLNYAVHANIIYHITKYIDWPDNKKSGNFVIGVIGDSPLYGEIKSFTANKMVGKQKIVIKSFSSSDASYNCQILFIAEDESRSLKKIATLTEGTPVLIISESDGLAQKGSCINFIIVDEHLKLEINKNNIEQRDLSIASEFLSLGKIVK